MKKVHLISSDNHENFVASVNAFIKGRLVDNIQYVAFPLVKESYDNGAPKTVTVVDRALITYYE